MGTIADLNELTAPAIGDFFVVRDISDVLDKDKKMTLGKVGLLTGPNTWAGNQSINGLATSGSALSVTRNLAAANTDAPVVDILQDNAGDDQVALRIKQDGTGDIFQAYDDAIPALIVKKGGFVGIGTATPFNVLHVQKSAVTGADSSPTDFFVVENNGHCNMNLIGNPANAAQLLFSDDVRAAGAVAYNFGTDTMTFVTATTTSMTIDAAGFVGIGTPSPFNMLHVRKAVATGADAHVDDVVVVENAGLANLNLIGLTAGQILFSDADRARGFFSYNHSLDTITIGSAGVTAMSLNNAGAPAFPLMAVLAGTAVHASAAGVLTKATSSKRYKRNIRNLSEKFGDDLIKALRPVLYQEKHHFVGDQLVAYKKDEEAPDRVGLISEEVYKASGEAFVMLDAEGRPDGLSYERLVAPLIGAVQRLMARVDGLENRLLAWEGK